MKSYLHHAETDLSLATLIEASQVFSRELSNELAFKAVLDILAERHELIRGFVAILDTNSRSIRLEATLGLSDAAKLASHTLGEGIVGKVIETGKPIVLPQVSREPMAPNHAEKWNGGRQELSHVCVPIVVNGVVGGGLGVDLRFKADRDYQFEVHYLSLIASMMAHAIKAQHLIEAERDTVIDEDTGLFDRSAGRRDLTSIVGTASPMRRIFEQIDQVCYTNTTVLLRGESGTGKELIANAIHHNSPRAQQPFVKVNCAALPESLIESELFGHDKGAFTDAHRVKKGRFELAEGGTLFLDEIGDTNLATQVKLLRVLQEREFERVGGTRTIRANVRLIAGTNKDLEGAMREGTFRPDLYYRLNVFAILVPPLRERKSDLLLLSEHFLRRFAHAHKKDVRRISTAAVAALTAHNWPGNVRELQNVIERAVLTCDGGVIQPHHLPRSLQNAPVSDSVFTLSFTESVAAFEKDMLVDALKTTRGNRTRAASLLRTTERVINYKIRKYRIDANGFRFV